MKYLEVFQDTGKQCQDCNTVSLHSHEKCYDCGSKKLDEYKKAWYAWFCIPGCIPDSDAFGPYETEKLALEDMERIYGEE